MTISLSHSVSRVVITCCGLAMMTQMINIFLSGQEGKQLYEIKINLYSSNCESTVRQPNEKRAAFYPIRHDRQLLIYSSTLLFFWEPPAAVLIVHESPELLLVVQHVNWAVGGGSYSLPGARSKRQQKSGSPLDGLLTRFGPVCFDKNKSNHNSPPVEKNKKSSQPSAVRVVCAFNGSIAPRQITP